MEATADPDAFGPLLPTNRTQYCPWPNRSIWTELVVLPGWKQLKPGTSAKLVLLAPVVLTTAVPLMPPALQNRWKSDAGEPSSLPAFAAFVAFAAFAALAEFVAFETFRPGACFAIS